MLMRLCLCMLECTAVTKLPNGRPHPGVVMLQCVLCVVVFV